MKITLLDLCFSYILHISKKYISYERIWFVEDVTSL